MNERQINNKMFVLVLFALLLLVGTASAEGPIWESKADWNTSDVGNNSAPAFADLDGDGDYDLLIGADNGMSYGCENTGSASSPTWTVNTSWDTPDIGDFAVPAFADLDSDGDYDLLIGEREGISCGYENTGSSSSPTWTANTSWNTLDVGSGSCSNHIGHNYAVPAFADLDGDGDNDLLIGDYYKGSYGFENTGSTSSPTWTRKADWDIVSVDVDYHAAPVFADLDGDGDYDLLISAYNGVSYSYENTGSTSSPTWVRKAGWDAPDIGDYAVPAFADLDGDGDYDLLVGEMNGVSCGYMNAAPTLCACTCGDICVNTSGWWRSGDAFNSSGTPIQAAVDNATVGETICVAAGSYTENVNVSKRVTLRGEGVCVVNVSAASADDHVFEVTVDYVNISGFNVTGATGSGDFGKAGIFIYRNIDYCNISDNNASSNYIGIYLFSGNKYNTITNNTANSNNVGIYLEYSSNNNTLMNNTVSNNSQRGIYLLSSSNNTIYNNYFNNTYNAYDNGNNTWNTTPATGTNIFGGSWLGGNYWSDYTGADTTGDGLGDTLLPYNSSGNISNGGDYHPLVTPGFAANITSYAPESPVNDTYCTWRTFNVSVDQTVNVTWYLDEASQHTNMSVTEANYTFHADDIREHNVSALAKNANGTDIQMWVWNVTQETTPPAITINTPTRSSPDNITGGEQFRVNFTYTELYPTNYTITIGNATVVINSTTNESVAGGTDKTVNESFYFNASAADGWYNVTVEMYDNSSNHNITYQNHSIEKGSYNASISHPENQTTEPSVNATYELNITNTGSFRGSFTLAVTNHGGADIAALNKTTIMDLASGASQNVTLNVTDASAGRYNVTVNVTSTYSGSEVANTSYIMTTVLGPTSTLEITNVTNTIPASGSVTITWDTDKNSDSLVRYGTSAGIYTFDKSDAPMVTSHSVTLTDLDSGTIYYFVVNSTDESGNSNESSEQSFRTPLENGSISGIVTDSTTGRPIRDATVSAGTMSTRTGTDGTYTISSIVHDTYSLNTTATGYTWNNNTVVTVSSGVMNSSGNVSLTPEKVTLKLESSETTIIKSSPNGTQVIFNLTATNYGTNATFTVTNSSDATVVTGCGSFVLNSKENTSFSITATNQTAGYYPIKITVTNSSLSKSASITFYAVMQNMSANYTTKGSCTVNTTNKARVTGSSMLVSSTVDTGANVNDSTLVHANVTEGANVTGESLVQYSNITGSGSVVGNGSVVEHSTVDNSTMAKGAISKNSIVVDSALDNTTLTDSGLYGNTIITDSTVVNVTANKSTIIGVEIDTGYSITLTNVTVRASASSGKGGRPEIQGGTNANVITRGVNFTNIYTDVLIEDLVLQYIGNKTAQKNTSMTINASGTVKCDLTVNMTETAIINITETGINPDGEGTESILSEDTLKWIPVGSFICIQHNASGEGNFTIRRYYDPSLNYTEVYIYYYNTTSNPDEWERLNTTANGTKGGLKWIEAVVNHLSTFVLMGTLEDDSGSTTVSSSRGSSNGPYITSTPTVLATEVQTAVSVSEDDDTATPTRTETEDEETSGLGVDTGTDESAPVQTGNKGLLIFSLVGVIVGVIIIILVIRRKNESENE